MATNSMAISHGVEARNFSRGAVVVLGRFFFVLIFLMSGPLHFSKQEVAYAAAQGVPLASILVPFSGVLAFAGGLSILLGYRAKLGVKLFLHLFFTYWVFGFLLGPHPSVCAEALFYCTDDFRPSSVSDPCLPYSLSPCIAGRRATPSDSTQPLVGAMRKGHQNPLLSANKGNPERPFRPCNCPPPEVPSDRKIYWCSGACNVCEFQ